jgi:hypothetical protein
MKYRTKKFQKLWLNVTAFVIGSFAPVFFLGSMYLTREPARLTLDFLSFPIDGQTKFDSTDTMFLSALTGGFLMGWGITIYFLGKKLYDKAPNEVRLITLYGIIAWFLTDSTGSALSGNPSNVIFNLIVLLIAVGPLWWKPIED